MALRCISVGDNIDQFARDHNHFADAQALGKTYYVFVLARGRFYSLATGIGSHFDLPAQLAVHLDNQLQRILNQRGFIQYRPGSVDRQRRVAQLLPQRMADMRSNRGQQQADGFQPFLQQSAILILSLRRFSSTFISVMTAAIAVLNLWCWPISWLA